MYDRICKALESFLPIDRLDLLDRPDIKKEHSYVSVTEWYSSYPYSYEAEDTDDFLLEHAKYKYEEQLESLKIVEEKMLEVLKVSGTTLAALLTAYIYSAKDNWPLLIPAFYAGFALFLSIRGRTSTAFTNSIQIQQMMNTIQSNKTNGASITEDQADVMKEVGHVNLFKKWTSASFYQSQTAVYLITNWKIGILKYASRNMANAAILTVVVIVIPMIWIAFCNLFGWTENQKPTSN
jgi:hypothetical protein